MAAVANVSASAHSGRTVRTRGGVRLAALAFGAVVRRPGPTLALLAGGGLATLFLINALSWQPERHHAPFFTGAAPMQAMTPVPLPPSRQALPPELVQKTRQDSLVTDVTAELTRRGFFIPADGARAGTKLDVAVRDYQEAAGLPADGLPSEALLAHLATSKLKISDQILQMLKPGQPDPKRTATAAQRALNKLGYGPLTEDGAVGAGTHAAIERFERDRKLPIKGELGGRLLKELAIASGLPVD